MKSKLITIAVVAAVLGGIVVMNKYEPRRMAEAHYEAEQRAIEALEGVEESEQSSQRRRMSPEGRAAEEIKTAANADGEDAAATTPAKDYRVTF